MGKCGERKPSPHSLSEFGTREQETVIRAEEERAGGRAGGRARAATCASDSITTCEADLTGSPVNLHREAREPPWETGRRRPGTTVAIVRRKCCNRPSPTTFRSNSPFGRVIRPLEESPTGRKPEETHAHR